MTGKEKQINPLSKDERDLLKMYNYLDSTEKYVIKNNVKTLYEVEIEKQKEDCCCKIVG